MNNNFSYAIFPLSMLKDNRFEHLSCKEFFLYMLLLNRVNLSKINRKHFSDKNGIFIYYTISEIEKDLRCGHNSAINILRNLESAGLISKQYQKKGLPLKIYVNDIREAKTEKPSPKYIPKPNPKETSFDIDKAKEQAKLNRYNFGELKNPRARQKKE